ncbi:MAG: hypothetical protein ACI8W7_002404 [Gammaproteobacteria bacterium]
MKHVHVSELEPRRFSSEHTCGEGYPLVIDGALDAIGPCSMKWLVELLPDKGMPARLYGPGHFDKPKAEWKKYSDIIHVRPCEYADMLLQGRAREESIYLAQVPIGESALGAHLRPAIDRVGTATGLRAAIDLNLWWGPGGHTEPLHYDSGDGTLAQLYGEKQVALFAPSQSKNLYPFPLSRRGIAPWISRVYLNRPDDERFPRLKLALPHRLDVTLKAGQILYIPANWWHEVTAVSSGFIVSINRFWKVAPLTRLFSNRVTPVVYPISMLALALARRRASAGHKVEA